MAVVVHAPDALREGPDRVADEFMVRAPRPRDAQHFKRTLRVLAVDGSVARVGLGNRPVQVVEEVRERLLLEAEPVHEGAGAFVAVVWRDADGVGEVLESLAPHAPELTDVAAVPAGQPLAERLDSLR